MRMTRVLLVLPLACAVAAPTRGADATVKMTSKLGVESSFVAKDPYSSAPRPVERLLQQYKPDDDPGVLLALTPNAFLIVPLGAVKTAVVKDGKARLDTAIGEFTGTLASGLTAEGDRRYDLASAVSVEVSHPTSKRADGKDPSVKPRTPLWRLGLPARPDTNFELAGAEVRFGFYTSAGYIRGGENTFYDSGQESFKLRVGGEEIAAQLSDFAEIAFSQAAGKLMARVKAPKGQTTTGEFVVTQSDSAGEHVGHTRFLVGRLKNASACFVLVGDKEPSFTLTRLEQ